MKTTPIRFLRTIPIAFKISGLGAGETLNQLTFDGLDVNPGGLVADSNGQINGTFNIPPKVTSGTKAVRAVTGSNQNCRAVFAGRGRMETTTLQEVRTVQRFQQTVIERRPVNDGGGGIDPQAQSFSLTEGRHISSLDIKFCAIGDRNEPVIVEFVTVDNGFPTTEIIAQTEINMQGVQTGVWTRFNFPVPFFLPAGQLFAFVVKSNDPSHSISVASRGDFDVIKQQWIAGQPYTVGTRFSSSNAISWTVHQDSDITFSLQCALFNPVTRTIVLGTYNVVDCSDLIIRADVFLPTDETSVIFEVDFGGEPTVRLLPDQVWERTSFYTGEIVVRAVLSGSSFASPVVQKDILAIVGTMQTTGVYVSRSFVIGTSVDLRTIASTKLPVGSSLVVEVDKNDDVWTAVPQLSATPIDLGFIERTYGLSGFSAPTGGRLRLTLAGTPGARPSVADLREFSI